MKIDRRKRGAVLIAVLALAALSAAIAMEVAYLTRVEGDRVKMERDRVQAELMARAGYDFALEALAHDPTEIDSLEDIWAKPIEWSRDEGRVSVAITDEASRFPLQKLFDASGLLDVGMRTRFDRLLAALELPTSLSDKLIDYSDADNTPFPEGAEAEAYLAMQPPRRPANRPIQSLEELEQVAGFDSATAAKLAEHVTLWNAGPVNINTASPEVLMACCGKLVYDQADRIVARAKFSRYSAVKDVTDVAVLDAGGLDELSSQAGVASKTYRIVSRGVAGGVDVVLTTIVERQGERFAVKYRRME